MLRAIAVLVGLLIFTPLAAVGSDPAPPPAAPVTDPLQPPVTAAVPEDPAGPTGPAAIPSASKDLPHDLSPWGMFMAADWVVKAVMIGLAIASLVTWTIWLAKSIELARARRTAAASLMLLNDARSLSEILLRTANSSDTTSLLARSAQAELELSADTTDKNGIRQRVESRMERLVFAAGRQINRGTGPLATIGSTAPFVGLFGTVWGIMNSFIGISQAKTTNLAVVAPGIAEALLATALGLVAAIPAVVIYNQFSRATASYRASLGDAAAAIVRLVSRDLDRDHSAKSTRLKAVD